MSSEHRPDLQTGRRPTLDGRGVRVAIVGGRFNDRITDALLDGCRTRLKEHGVTPDDVEELWAPGAFELPLVARELAVTGRYDVVVTLGAVIRGDTPHFDYVAGACADSMARVALDTGVPVIFGVLTTDTVGQAMARCKPGPQNKGAEAADAAVEMAQLVRGIRSGPSSDPR